MPVTDTPLRYPGGKSQLTPLVVDILHSNDLTYGEYAEPFAGGAGIALHLLLNSYVSHIYLNDFDPAIHAFWTAVLHHHEALCELVERAEVNINEWHRQRQIALHEHDADPLTRGFAVLFLNRTNRSGIIKAGVIGGLEQLGTYKLDCRFNRSDLIRKIKRIAGVRDQISLSQLDAIEFLRKVVPSTSKYTLVNLDPPYFGKGPDLYTNFYKPNDHAALAKEVNRIKRRWMVTYDDTPEIRSLYSEHPMYSSRLNYSAQVKKVGTELLVLDPELVPPSLVLNMPRVELRSAA